MQVRTPESSLNIKKFEMPIFPLLEFYCQNFYEFHVITDTWYIWYILSKKILWILVIVGKEHNAYLCLHKYKYKLVSIELQIQIAKEYQSKIFLLWIQVTVGNESNHRVPESSIEGGHSSAELFLDGSSVTFYNKYK